MPRGRVEPRTVVCRDCDRPFVTDLVGKATWRCPECKPTPREPGPPRQPAKPKPAPARQMVPAPLREDFAVVLRLADEIGANPRVLRDSVVALARGEGDMRFFYRRLAASALCLAAYVGGHRL